MTLDLEPIRARLNEATTSPWRIPLPNAFRVIAPNTPNTPKAPGADYPWFVVGDMNTTADAEFVAHARSDVADLVEEVEDLRERLDLMGLAYIEASNPGIDMDQVRALRRAVIGHT